MTNTRIIRLAFADIRELLCSYVEFSDNGGLFWRTRQELVDGEEVVVEIGISGHSERFSFECVVGGSPRDKGFHAESGYLLSFKEYERPKRDRLLDVAGRDIIGVNRRFHRRYHKTLAVAWRMGDEDDMQLGHTENVSLGGAFVRSEVVAPEESLLTMHLRCGGTRPPIRVNGRVAWTRGASDDLGMGVQFLGLEPSESIQLQKVITTKD